MALQTENEFPTYLELKQFIKNNQKATVCEIRDKFNQSGDSVISIIKPNCTKKKIVLAYSINGLFFQYLQEFMKEDYVICDTDHMACLISDQTKYIGSDEFLPLVLSIN